ncbi:MAG: Nramp family divalent metal transporter [Nocardiopsaceae bacterium]|nr:Nramp family divalent metal transporter [Nocardiopsaceae bacterium]
MTTVLAEQGAVAARQASLRQAPAVQQALSGQRRGLRAVVPFLGPAFIASVAYTDPGNFATNMAGGARFGYALGWVVLTANVMAMGVQALSAKLGIATGRSLPEVCRDRLPRRVVVVLWLQAEAVAMATDLAEFTGAALGLHLVFGLPMWTSALLAGLATFAVLGMEVRGFRRLEAVITALVVVVVLAFGAEMFTTRPPAGAVAAGALTPHLPAGSALLAVSIVGATVMPHVIYLHSSLAKPRAACRCPGDRRKIFRFELVDILIAMGLAGVINLAMLATAAAVFGTRGLSSAGGDLGVVYTGLNAYAGAHAGTIFGVALMVSGIASSCVGTMSGQVVMQGFLRRQVPVFARRAITMLPALALIASGFSATRALVLSQAFLSFGIPFALIPLLWFTSRRSLMGPLVNRRVTTIAAVAVTALIVTLNLSLLATCPS